MIPRRVAGLALLLAALAAPRLNAQIPALVPLPSEVQAGTGAFVLPDTVTVTLAPTTRPVMGGAPARGGGRLQALTHSGQKCDGSAKAASSAASCSPG